MLIQWQAFRVRFIFQQISSPVTKRFYQHSQYLVMEFIRGTTESKHLPDRNN